MIIQHNLGGMNAARNKGMSETKMKKSLEKLSSGYRINRAGDDAAGLAISELLGRMKTLAVQSANATYTTVARENLDFEREELIAEINRIGETSDFDDIPLFDSSEQFIPSGAPFQPPVKADKITLQIGHSADEILDVNRYVMTDKGLGLDAINIRTQADANAAIENIEIAIEAVADIRAEFGAAYNHLEHTHNNLSVTSENMTSAESRIRDTDMADEFTSFTRDNIVYQAANSMVAQANAVPQQILSLLQ